VNSSHLSVDLPGDVIQGLRRCLETLALALNLTSGLVHTQFLLQGKEFYLVEMMRRCPGDLYATLIEKSTGVDYAGIYAAAFCGATLALRRGAEQPRFFSRHTVSLDHDCVFFSSSLAIPDAKISLVPLKKTGEPLYAAPMDRAGIYFTEHSSAREMSELTPQLKDYVTVEALAHV
jgi:hypothetical protein